MTCSGPVAAGDQQRPSRAVAMSAVAMSAVDRVEHEQRDAATDVWPAYDEYQAGTDRRIPLFVLDPVDAGHRHG